MNLFETNRAVRRNNKTKDDFSSHVFDNLAELQMHRDYTLALDSEKVHLVHLLLNGAFLVSEEHH